MQSYDELPNLSRVDRLLDDRFGPRNQRESNYGPRSYSEDMQLNKIDSDIRGDWSKVKYRRQDIDGMLKSINYANRFSIVNQITNSFRNFLGNPQLRGNRPIQQSKLPADSSNKMLPIPHPIPVLIPIFMSHPYPMPVFHHPMNFSTMQTSHPPHDDIHKHEHVVLIRDHDHHLDGHVHEHVNEHVH